MYSRSIPLIVVEYVPLVMLSVLPHPDDFVTAAVDWNAMSATGMDE